MSGLGIVASCLWGQSGEYHVLGVPVKFELTNTSESVSIASQYALSILILRHMDAFVHGMGHALMAKRLGVKDVSLIIGKLPVGCRLADSKDAVPKCEKATVVRLAGPICGIIFASCKLALFTAVRRHLGRPVTLLLGGIEILKISNELFLNCIAALKKDKSHSDTCGYPSPLHIKLADAVVIGEIAFGIFLITKKII